MGESNVERAAIRSTWSQVGRTQDAVQCACGALNHFYRWSWAGHGKARCHRCRGWIDYVTLYVTEAEAKGGR